MTVTLTWSERCLAAQVGLWRHFRAVREQRKPTHGLRGGEGELLAFHVDGAIGEMAFAKSQNVYWSGSVDTFKSGGDVGTIHVRARSRPDYELNIRDDDPDGVPFVLVRGSLGTYEIVGWMWSHEAKQPYWQHDYGNRGAPAWFVPDRYLRALATLPLDRTGG